MEGAWSDEITHFVHDPMLRIAVHPTSTSRPSASVARPSALISHRNSFAAVVNQGREGERESERESINDNDALFA